MKPMVHTFSKTKMPYFFRASFFLQIRIWQFTFSRIFLWHLTSKMMESGSKEPASPDSGINKNRSTSLKLKFQHLKNVCCSHPKSESPFIPSKSWRLIAPHNLKPTILTYVDVAPLLFPTWNHLQWFCTRDSSLHLKTFLYIPQRASLAIAYSM